MDIKYLHNQTRQNQIEFRQQKFLPFLKLDEEFRLPVTKLQLYFFAVCRLLFVETQTVFVRVLF